MTGRIEHTAAWSQTYTNIITLFLCVTRMQYFSGRHIARYRSIATKTKVRIDAIHRTEIRNPVSLHMTSPNTHRPVMADTRAKGIHSTDNKKSVAARLKIKEFVIVRRDRWTRIQRHIKLLATALTIIISVRKTLWTTIKAGRLDACTGLRLAFLKLSILDSRSTAECLAVDARCLFGIFL